MTTIAAARGMPSGPIIRRAVPVALAIVATLGLAVTAQRRPEGALVPLGLLAVVLLIAVLVVKPYLLAPLVVVGFALQPALKFQVSSSVGPAKDAVIVAGALAAGLAVLRRGRVAGDRLVLLLVLGFLSIYVLNPAGRHGAGWGFVTRLVFEGLVLLLVGYLSTNASRTWRWGARSAIVVGVAESVIGVVQQAIGLKTLVVQYGYAYGEQVRATSGGQLRSFGTLDDPFNYAAIVILGLVCALHVVENARLRWGLVAVMVVGVLVSFDRTAVVLVAALLLLELGRKHSASAICLALAMAVGGLALVVDRSPAAPPSVTAVDNPAANNTFLLSLNGRTSTWLQVFRGPGDVLFGRGAGEIGAGAGRAGQQGVAAVAHYQPGVAPPIATNVGLTSLDSTYFETLADAGVVGLLVLLLLGARVLSLLRAGQHVRGAPASAARGIFLLLAADGVTRTSLFAFPFGFIAMFLLGSALGACTSPPSDAGRAQTLQSGSRGGRPSR